MRLTITLMLLCLSYLGQSQSDPIHNHIVGKYIWKGDLKSPYGYCVGVREIEIKSDLTFVLRDYDCHPSLTRSNYKSRNVTLIKGRVLYVKGQMYLMAPMGKSLPYGNPSTIKINRRRIKFIGISRYGKIRSRNGLRLKKAD